MIELSKVSAKFNQSVLIGLATIGISGASVFIDQGSAFAESQQEINEQIKSGKLIDVNLIGYDAKIALQKARGNDQKLDEQISEYVRNGQGPLVKIDSLPTSVRKKITLSPIDRSPASTCKEVTLPPATEKFETSQPSSKLFTETQQETIELLKSRKLIDTRLICSDAQNALREARASDPKLDEQIKAYIQNGKGPLVRVDSLPDSVRKNFTMHITENESYQPSQISQTSQPASKSSDNLNLVPIILIGLAGLATVGAIAYNFKSSDVSKKSQSKKFKGKGNEIYGMSNKNPDGIQELEVSDKIAEQMAKLHKAEQAELNTLKELQILEEALNLAVKEGLSKNSIAYRNAKDEIDKKKAAMGKKYLE